MSNKNPACVPMKDQKAFEEWKITRSTIVEFDRILVSIRALDITATPLLLVAGFQYTHWFFVCAIILNAVFLLLEKHYHNYLNSVAEHAMCLENKIGFNLTNVINLARNEYKQNGKTSVKYWWGLIIAYIYYIMYVGFMIIGAILFILSLNSAEIWHSAYIFSNICSYAYENMSAQTYNI